jgi:hypothetical protein
MDDKITIIEGPPPTFEPVGDVWANGIAETPTPGNVVVTRLRTFNGPALVERCHRAWRHKRPIHLEYKGRDSFNREALIVASRYTESDNGQLLILWLRLPEHDIKIEFHYDDWVDDDDDFDSLDLNI